MKKIFWVILYASLIFALCGVFCFATSENTTEVQTNETSNVTPSTEQNASIVESNSTIADDVIEKLTDSTLWINIGSVALACLGIIATVGNKFKSITSLISKKADSNTVIDTQKKASDEIREEFKSELQRVKSELTDAKNTGNKLFTILTIFITNAKINPAAKAEIMNYITGIKKFDGTPDEIIENANKAIAEAIVTEEKVETPALDKIVKENIMELG